jgi:hypothetical protein
MPDIPHDSNLLHHYTPPGKGILFTCKTRHYKNAPHMYGHFNLDGELVPIHAWINESNGNFMVKFELAKHPKAWHSITKLAQSQSTQAPE